MFFWKEGETGTREMHRIWAEGNVMFFWKEGETGTRELHRIWAKL
jgi:hypothetical protein